MLDIEDSSQANRLNRLLTSISDGKPLDSLPELGPYTQLCQLLADVMPNAPHRAAREGMLKAVRRMPGNKPFDDLLRRGSEMAPYTLTQNSKIRCKVLKSLHKRL